mmetsp:Transcript_69490/g.184988  ORF Transcript_69490/g.184988 Transcript_69490/m.184988 type:complete len:201 (-) Transcript_69490:176-778(-)
MSTLGNLRVHLRPHLLGLLFRRRKLHLKPFHLHLQLRLVFPSSTQLLLQLRYIRDPVLHLLSHHHHCSLRLGYRLLSPLDHVLQLAHPGLRLHRSLIGLLPLHPPVPGLILHPGHRRDLLLQRGDVGLGALLAPHFTEIRPCAECAAQGDVVVMGVHPPDGANHVVFGLILHLVELLLPLQDFRHRRLRLALNVHLTHRV